MEKEICKDILNRSKEIGLQYTDLLGDGGFCRVLTFSDTCVLVIVNVY